MGMFDEVRCEYPLPDGFDTQGVWFQTKDTPEQYLQRYVLCIDGALVVEDTRESVPFHGALTFYTTNVCGVSPKGVITDDNMAPYWAEYCALYDHGVLIKLEGGCALDTDHPWITRDVFYSRAQSLEALP